MVNSEIFKGNLRRYSFFSRGMYLLEVIRRSGFLGEKIKYWFFITATLVSKDVGMFGSLSLSGVLEPVWGP
jgi:hypothetical protein